MRVNSVYIFMHLSVVVNIYKKKYKGYYSLFLSPAKFVNSRQNNLLPGI